MKLKEVLDKTITFFRDKKIETPRLDAELIFAHALNLERIQLYLKFDQPLEESELSRLRELVRRRSQGEPVAYILGSRDFFGYRFAVNSSTLIPRPESEHLVEEVMAWVSSKETALNLLDLGCGSGAIGLSLLKQFPNAKLLAVDISAEALKVAKHNAETLHVAERVHFFCVDGCKTKDVMASFKEHISPTNQIDIFVSNPPYIDKDDLTVELNVKKYEPNSALFAEDQGLYFLKLWSQVYCQYLSERSLMLMEMGHLQGPMMREHFISLGVFNQVRVIKDLAGNDRIIYGDKNG